MPVGEPYDLTSMENATSVLDIFTAVNDAAGNNLLGSLLLTAVFVILVISLIRNNPIPESFLSAGLICTILSLLLLFVGLANIAWVIGFALITAVAGIALFKSNSV